MALVWSEKNQTLFKYPNCLFIHTEVDTWARIRSLRIGQHKWIDWKQTDEMKGDGWFD